MAGLESETNFLKPPAVLALRDQDVARLGALRGQMERTTSADIREEGKDLKEAAEQSMNVILDITLDGKVRWASETWQHVVGTPVDSIRNHAIADVLVENKSAFDDAIQALQANDTRSKNIRFAVLMGPLSSLTPEQTSTVDVNADHEASTVHVLELEGQGILVYDRSTGEASHTMWMIRPFTQKEVTIDLPEVLVESLGDGAELLAQHLTQLAEAGTADPQHNPPPLPVLCRICERQITPWWFPKHTELCLHEHRAEADLQMAQEQLTDHRNAIVKVLDALEAQTGYRASPLGDNAAAMNITPEYKGMPIGLTQSPLSDRASPGSSPIPSRERPSTGQRTRSWAIRRPLSRIVELVLDLCDTALEISQPALKDTRSEDGELRTQSPQSESRISQVIQWQSPSAGYLEHEPGLSALSDDTAQLSKAKVEAVLSFRRILEYSERIRTEFTTLVQDCIDAALEKAARIAAGEDSSDSGEEIPLVEEDEGEQMTVIEAGEGSVDIPSSTRTEFRRTFSDESSRSLGIFGSSYDGPSAMSLALRQVSTRSPSPSSSPPIRIPSAMSTRSSSPRACPTPRTLGPAFNPGSFPGQQWQSLDTDTGAESDSSVRSSIRSRKPLLDSPGLDQKSVSRVASRERKRKSLVISRAPSAERHPPQARSIGPSMSPLRIPKPRLPGGAIDRSPMMSPVLAGSEFISPSLPAPLVPFHRRQSSISSDATRSALSPRLSIANQPPPRANPPSIKDFEIIKPISKGAFGSVYLTKKKSTGDYYAIKALRKADMVAKNQVANVKAERAIMMWQGESDFVAKLYWTFPSKDYVFLVMEYLNGGDCASLLHALGTLPEDWAKRYLAEIVLGVEHLHSRGIVHRDLKPDNFLIDQKGHLKLTDFGLSRMGLIGRQKRALSAKNTDIGEPFRQGHFQRSVSLASSRSASASFDIHANVSPGQTPNMTPVVADLGQPSYFALSRESSGQKESQRQTSSHHSESGDPDQLEASFRRFSLYNDLWNPSRSSPREEMAALHENAVEGYPLAPSTSNTTNRVATPPIASNMAPPPMALFDPEDQNRKFVGTPDYLSPETINGVGQDEMSDWWSLGCILFEFLFGYPPFHADTPEKVFEKILARDIDWPPEDEDDVSSEAKDLMNRLMAVDPTKRLGANTDEKYASGGEEIRKHPWFADIDWAHLTETEASFIPAPANPEDTEYFETRGAVPQDFTAEFEDQETSPPSLTPGVDYERPHDALSRVRKQVNSMKRGLMPLHIPLHVRDGRNRRSSEPVGADDFGQFSFKNLPVLEKANKDVIQKLRAEAMQAQSRGQPSLSIPISQSPPSMESGSPISGGPIRRSLSKSYAENRSASPSMLSHTNSSPSRASQPSSPLVQFSAGGHHERRKTSSSSSTLSSSMAMASGLQLGSLADVPRFSSSFKSNSTASSPIRSAKSPIIPGPGEKSSLMPLGTSTRARSQTVGSNDSDTMIKDRLPHHHKRRSQVVIDVSPSSSDTDDPRQKALLRVQRRRQSSRRMSVISFNEGPLFRPLDVLVSEEHPVSSLVMTKLLEKLKCRAIIVHDGAEALRYATGSVKFDIIMVEYKLPSINGADVARMIRETKNPNCQTPIVAVTGYLKELQAPHHFDALVEKPPTMNKLTEVMQRLCAWRPQSNANQVMQGMPPMPPSGLRTASVAMDEIDGSPSSLNSDFLPHLASSYRGSSRQDSMSSVSVLTDDRSEESSGPTLKRLPDDWRSSHSGLGIDVSSSNRRIPSLLMHESAPSDLGGSELSPRRSPSPGAIDAKRKALARERTPAGDTGDDEDEELGRARPRSHSPKARQLAKLSSPTPGASRHSPESSIPKQGWKSPMPSPPSLAYDVIIEEGHEGMHEGTISPPILFSPRLDRLGGKVMEFNMDPGSDTGPSTPTDTDLERTPRASKEVSPRHTD